ncbi:hypothetical protein FE251_11950 [Georgenia wutianyii]|uniref:Uncharacterized protein n=1 Tax=Georgenia wutianyii TaxID=2585135 RepID=A0ABX5VNH1_9MICO|nr:hypothetical protein [Georgenia wutianyii]QDB80012.1 hypothetical protein FE251_11950 [Georgenia wutianyii]
MREPLYYLSSRTPTGQYTTPGEAPGLFHLGQSPGTSVAARPHGQLGHGQPRFAGVRPSHERPGSDRLPVEPVRLSLRDEELPRWGRLIVTGSSPRSWSGFRDEHVREKRYVDNGPWSPDHACFDPAPDGWDGSDVFHPAETAFVVVTERVKDALVAARLNVEIERAGLKPFPLTYALDGTEEAWRRRMAHHARGPRG